VTSNRTILEKADLALNDLITDGGYLQPAQAQKFLRLLVKESVVLKQSTVVPMRAPKQLIEKIRFGSRVLRPGAEGHPLDPGDRVKPDLGKVELDAQLFKAEVHLNDEVLEDNIENGELRQTIMQILGEAIARDMDEVIINGDTGSGDPFLAVLDGILVQAGSNVVVAGGVPLNKDVLRDMLKAMPSEYLRSKIAMRYFTSVDAELDYRNTLANRATVAGDKFLEQDTPIIYSGVPLIAVPMFPEDLGQGHDQTAVILTHPKNINVGIWRKVKLETDRDVSGGFLKVVATLRFDVKYAEETAVVKATGVLVA